MWGTPAKKTVPAWVIDRLLRLNLYLGQCVCGGEEEEECAGRWAWARKAPRKGCKARLVWG